MEPIMLAACVIGMEGYLKKKRNSCGIVEIDFLLPNKNSLPWTNNSKLKIGYSIAMKSFREKEIF